THGLAASTTSNATANRARPTKNSRKAKKTVTARSGEPERSSSRRCRTGSLMRPSLPGTFVPAAARAATGSTRRGSLLERPGLTHDDAPEPGHRVPRRDLDGLVERVALEHVEARDVLADLGVRTLDHAQAAAAHAHGPCLGHRTKPLA